MPSILTNEQLKVQLNGRTERLHRMVKLQMPKSNLLKEVAMVVSTMRLLYGRELVDKVIEDHQSRIDIQEAGLCCQCGQKPAVVAYGPCTECDKDAEAEEFGNSLGDTRKVS